jgi:hypothetical protein
MENEFMTPIPDIVAENLKNNTEPIERKTGFYWCNIGRVRGRPTDWIVCYYDEVFKVWHIPVYNNIVHVRDEMKQFEEIDETKLEYSKK